jgi:hypothetical protein
VVEVSSFPTVLSPWFVVQKFKSLGMAGQQYFFCAVEIADSDCWTESKRNAMLFMSIHSAARVAQAEAGEIRALVTKEEADEFGRGETR